MTGTEALPRTSTQRAWVTHAVDWDRAGAGGSAAQITRCGDLAVKEGHDDLSRAKIDDERRWLRWVEATQPPALGACFVPVVESACRPGRLAMPWIEGTNARTLALHGALDLSVAQHAVRQAVTLFRGDRTEPDDLVCRWWSKQLRQRLSLAKQRRHYVPGLSSVRHVHLTGGVLPNPIHGGLGAVVDMLRRHPPSAVGPLHGDLHLGNLIVTTGGAGLWVDPRGRFDRGGSFDLAYDVAKLLHEPHYVAARARAIRTSVRTHHDHAEAVTERCPTTDDKRRLQPLTRASLALAQLVCRDLVSDDPLVAARATLYVGLLFITLLPFEVLDDGEWETMLLSGLLWLAAGQTALSCRLGLPDCQVLWRQLISDVEHDATAVTSPTGPFEASGRGTP